VNRVVRDLKTWFVPLPIFILLCTAFYPVQAQEQAIGYRLTIQIHEAPGINSYYAFYFNVFDLYRSGETPQNRTITLTVPGKSRLGGISAYPSDNSSFLSLNHMETDGGVSITFVSDSPSVDVRFYIPLTASKAGRAGDDRLVFPEPTIDAPLKSETISINWPNWRYQITKIEPAGAEQVMNPMFETDPYKAVSYYWYYSADEVGSRRPGDISVTLRSAATASRITRNESIIIITLVVCLPSAILIALHPPRKQEKKGGKPFRITDEKERRRVIRRGRYRVK